MQEKT